MFGEIALDQTGQRGQQDIFPITLDDDDPTCEKQVGFGNVEKPLKEAVI